MIIESNSIFTISDSSLKLFEDEPQTVVEVLPSESTMVISLFAPSVIVIDPVPILSTTSLPLRLALLIDPEVIFIKSSPAV